MSSRICYPRPDFAREIWTGLNGPWRFAFDDLDIGRDEQWEQHIEKLPLRIEVPFPYQSELSGIGEQVYHPLVWYAKEFIVPLDFQADVSRHILLCFGAVDWHCDLWVNGRHICAHDGGYTPFSADITRALRLPGEPNTAVLRVEDTRRCDQPRGKQYWKETPDRCWYTPCSGIWQSVWLESVPKKRIEFFAMQPRLADSCVECTLTLNEQPLARSVLEVEISFAGHCVRSVSMGISEICTTFTLPVKEEDYIDEVHYWTPEHPNLYDVSLVFHSDKMRDQVKTYFGMRSIQAKDGMILLNNRPFYQKLLLHQGYYAGGLLTAGDDDLFRSDLQLIKEMGFNGIRMHQKIEDPLLYYWADKLGLVVWAELPSCYEFNGIAMDQTARMMREFVSRDRNHPSIICWVPFNESWGVRNIYDNLSQQRYALSLYYAIKAMDPSRLVSTNDGWEQLESDLCCIHDYAPDARALAEKWDHIETLLSGSAHKRMIYASSCRYARQPVILSEFGGIAYKTDSCDTDWGYAETEKTEDSFIRRLSSLIAYVKSNKAIQGFCYTQFTDVMQEVNGLTDITRKPKVPAEALRKILG